MPLPHRDLLVSIAHASRLAPVAVSSLAGVGIIVIPLAAGVRFDFIDVTLLLHLSMAVTLGGTALILDDPAITSTRVLPVSAVSIAVARMAMTLVILTPAWLLQLAAAPHLVTSTGAYDAAGLFIEPYGVLAWTWVAACWRLNRSTDGSGASAAAPAMLIGLIALGFLPDRFALYLNPADPDFADSRLRWALLVASGVVALVVSMRRTVGGRGQKVRSPMSYPTAGRTTTR